ncbi:reverse transcriptase domain-containing protein [Tanacetum coccineum]|uniref:Reverse transcriptase domain-containing protein n=1 Tax=Tanacetum coccineum TaxID=301880 RepID=A0ABQ4ZCI1_9ASTR
MWVSPIHVVPKKGGMTVVLNENNELISSRTVTAWRVCIDFRKLNNATRKDHFPLPFIDQMLERLCGNEYYCFLDGFSRFFQISIAPEDQEKTTFTCPYGTFAYRRIPFGLCNAPATFQRWIRKFSMTWWKTLWKYSWTNSRYSNVPFELMCDASDFAVGAVLGQRIDWKFKPIYYASKSLNNAREHYTITEKELLAVVFSFDKFRPYLILSKAVVYTDHLALKYLFSKHDAKPRLIRLENLDLGTFTEEEIADKFPDEHLMILKTKLNEDEPWYAAMHGQCNEAMRYWNEILEILAHCHSGPTGGHHNALITRRKVYESRLFWPSIFKDAKNYVTRCDACQRSGNISSRSEMPQNNIQVEVQALPTNDARVVIKFLRRLFARFGVPKALITVAKNHFMELNELMELKDGAYQNTRIYKERTKRWHDSRLHGDKNFKVGDKVLRFNSRFKMHLGKLKSRWYGPNVVKTVYLYGTVEIIDRNKISFKVNGQRLKKYHDGHIDAEDNEVV